MLIFNAKERKETLPRFFCGEYSKTPKHLRKLNKKIRLPGFIQIRYKLLEINYMMRLERLVQKRHISLFGSFVTFLIIASNTCCYQILPCIFSSSGARHNMINGQMVPASAILAFMPVPPHDIFPGKLDFPVWKVYIPSQFDHCRKWKTFRNCTDMQLLFRCYKISLH